jgi:hypothetical protein
MEEWQVDLIARMNGLSGTKKNDDETLYYHDTCKKSGNPFYVWYSPPSAAICFSILHLF